eukprot:scaffold5782_cov185-Ochromonas_danica.AAC.2
MKKELGRYSLQPAELNGGSKIPWNYCLELWNLRSYSSMEDVSLERERERERFSIHRKASKV